MDIKVFSDLIKPFEQHYDKKYQRHFFHDPITKNSVWELPIDIFEKLKRFYVINVQGKEQEIQRPYHQTELHHQQQQQQQQQQPIYPQQVNGDSQQQHLQQSNELNQIKDYKLQYGQNIEQQNKQYFNTNYQGPQVQQQNLPNYNIMNPNQIIGQNEKVQSQKDERESLLSNRNFTEKQGSMISQQSNVSITIEGNIDENCQNPRQIEIQRSSSQSINRNINSNKHSREEKSRSKSKSSQNKNEGKKQNQDKKSKSRSNSKHSSSFLEIQQKINNDVESLIKNSMQEQINKNQMELPEYKFDKKQVGDNLNKSIDTKNNYDQKKNYEEPQSNFLKYLSESQKRQITRRVDNETQKILQKPSRKQISSQQSNKFYNQQDKYNNRVFRQNSDNKDSFRDHSFSALNRCDSLKDSGYTRADFGDRQNIYFCSHWAKGYCSEGQYCTFFHRVPVIEECLRIDNLRNIFGRKRHEKHREDRGGIGSYLFDTRSIEINYLNFQGKYTGKESQIYEHLYRHFSEWGDIQDIRYIADQQKAIISYLHRCMAEYAKEAMAHQSIENGEIIEIKWYLEYNNDQNQQKQKSENSQLRTIKNQGYNAQYQEQQNVQQKPYYMNQSNDSYNYQMNGSRNSLKNRNKNERVSISISSSRSLSRQRDDRKMNNKNRKYQNRPRRQSSSSRNERPSKKNKKSYKNQNQSTRRKSSSSSSSRSSSSESHSSDSSDSSRSSRDSLSQSQSQSRENNKKYNSYQSDNQIQQNQQEDQQRISPNNHEFHNRLKKQNEMRQIPQQSSNQSNEIIVYENEIPRYQDEGKAQNRHEQTNRQYDSKKRSMERKSSELSKKDYKNDRKKEKDVQPYMQDQEENQYNNNVYPQMNQMAQMYNPRAYNPQMQQQFLSAYQQYQYLYYQNYQQNDFKRKN